MNNIELDGIPLSEAEIELIREERLRLERYKAKKEKQKNCKHEDKVYIGHSHNDDAYGCRECGATIFE